MPMKILSLILLFRVIITKEFVESPREECSHFYKIINKRASDKQLMNNNTNDCITSIKILDVRITRYEI